MSQNQKPFSLTRTFLWAGASLFCLFTVYQLTAKVVQGHPVDETIENFTKYFSACQNKIDGAESRIKNIVKNTINGMDQNQNGSIDRLIEPDAYKTISAFKEHGITVCSGNLSKDDPDAALTIRWGTPGTTFFVNPKTDPNTAQAELKAALLFMGAGAGIKPH